MRKLTLTVFLIAVAGTIDASTIVAPNGNAAANGNGSSVVPFSDGTNLFEFQWQIAASQLTSMVGQDITAIGFRLQGGASSVASGTTIGTWDLELSGAANALGSLSTTLANNIGAGATTVYNNSLTLPALTGGAGPNPFFLISFTTPFLYTGGDLLMTLDVANAAPVLTIPVDANSPDANGNAVVQQGTRTGFVNYPITEFQFFAPSELPEPGSLVLFLTGGLALLGAGIRRKR